MELNSYLMYCAKEKMTAVANSLGKYTDYPIPQNDYQKIKRESRFMGPMAIVVCDGSYIVPNGTVILSLRDSYIITSIASNKVLPAGQVLIFAINCAERNITRRKPNITATQYNSPKANITGFDPTTHPTEKEAVALSAERKAQV